MRNATTDPYAASPDEPSVDDNLDEEEGLELPVDPDEGMPLIPDDERVIDVPS